MDECMRIIELIGYVAAMLGSGIAVYNNEYDAAIVFALWAVSMVIIYSIDVEGDGDDYV